MIQVFVWSKDEEGTHAECGAFEKMRDAWDFADRTRKPGQNVVVAEGDDIDYVWKLLGANKENYEY